MTELMKRKWRGVSPLGRWVCTGAVITCLCLAVVAIAADTDGDGLDDDWELKYFGDLSEDEHGDPDSDGLTNYAEYATTFTDPSEDDTDRDGWTDSTDTEPLSRAFIDWGNPSHCTGDYYDYPGVDWMTNAYRLDGEWNTNPPSAGYDSAWYASATTAVDVGSVNIDVDRTVLTNDVVLELDYLDTNSASLFVDLVDSAGSSVASDLFGNLMAGTDEDVRAYLDIPFELYPDAVGIWIRRGTGEVYIYEALVYVDLDGDGLDTEQEDQLGTSDTTADSDGDGLDDYEEHFTHNTDPLDTDSDDDGLDDGQEINTYGSDPNDDDTDDDKLSDGWEAANGFDPVSIDLDDIVGWWKLNESSGDAADSSGNGNDGTVNGATFTPARLGNGLFFDGDNDYVTIANSSDYRPADAVTVAAYVNFSELYDNTVSGAEDGHMVLLSHRNNAGHAYGFYKTENNSLVFEIVTGPSATANVETVACFVHTGEWFHVVGTYDKTNVSLYVNGELIGQTAHTAALDYDTMSSLIFGHGLTSVDGYFNGLLDDVRVFDVALTTMEVASLGDAGRDDDGDSLSNYSEETNDTDPFKADSDGDGMADDWEIANSLDPTSSADAASDADGDGVSNLQEFLYGSDPNDTDSDDDNLTDWEEINVTSTDPKDADTDDDTLNDWWEVRFGLNALVATSTSADSDGDGLTNAQEENLDTNPGNDDTDGDGMGDAWENTHSFDLTSGLTLTLKSWWRFDEGSGSYVCDDNRLWANDGRIENGCLRDPGGYAGACLLLDGDDDYGLVEDHYSLDSVDEFTVTFWLNVSAFDTPAQPVYFLSKEDSSGHVEYSVSHVESTGTLRFSHKNLSNQSETVSVSCDLPISNWVSIAVAVDGTSVTFFTNATQVGSAQTLSYSRDNVGDLVFGTTFDSGATDPTLHGKLDEVRFYLEELDAADLADLLEAEGDGDSDGLKDQLEALYGCDPADSDSDDDGWSDGLEVNTHGTSPTNADSDGDGIEDDVDGTPLSAANLASDPNITIITPEDDEYIFW